MPEIRVRPMRSDDLGAVFRIQCEAYPEGCHESIPALASRLVAAPDFCFVAEFQGSVLAYVLAHPWRGSAPSLHQALAGCGAADHVFLHDLCVSADAQGSAVGRRLHEAVERRALAHAFRHIRIVALEQADGFWLRRGFTPEAGAAVGESYGRARLMSKLLESLPA